MKITWDTLWKGIIEDLFSDLMGFLFPDELDQFDLSEVVFLDKDLEKLFPESTNQKRVVDKLIHVKRENGEMRWILIHKEVQGCKDEHFKDRMFTYFYRIYD